MAEGQSLSSQLAVREKGLIVEELVHIQTQKPKGVRLVPANLHPAWRLVQIQVGPVRGEGRQAIIDCEASELGLWERY